METEHVITALGAIANGSRLAIYRLLVETGEAGLAVGRIGEALGLPSATLSFHLKELKQAGLVLVRREGRSLIYSANYAAMTDLVDYLTRNCCGGDPASCGVPALPTTRDTV